MGDIHGNKLVTPDHLSATEDNAVSIYEGGNLSPISVKDLMGNELAIKQLINDHNLALKRIAKLNVEKESQLSDLNAEVGFLRTSPFFSIIFGVFNILGTILVGIGVNFVTSTKELGYLFIIIGGMASLITCAAQILFRYVRAWFNKKGGV